MKYIYDYLLCPTIFQVVARDEAQRSALKSLPGRHSWRHNELPIATGFVDEPEKLTTRLTHLFGRNWKEYFMYLALFFSLVSVGNKWTDKWNGRVSALGNKSELFFKSFFFNWWRSFSIFVILKVKPSSPFIEKKKTLAPSVGCQGVSSSIYIHKHYFKALFF